MFSLSFAILDSPFDILHSIRGILPAVLLPTL